MSVPGQPLKLNYAKGRQKSKSKNQLESQQKIQFDNESSTDIFAHLNQDNLNYIKKQLKHKKSGQSQQKAKPSNFINDQIRDFMKVKEQQGCHFKTSENDKKATDMTSSNSKQILKQKAYQQNNSIIALESTLQPTIPYTITQRQKVSKLTSLRQRNSYQGLQPPPLTYTTKPKSITVENISQKFQNKKINSKSIHQNEIKSNNGLQREKNNFLEYELKSETSNNPIGQSNVLSEDKSQLEDILSVHQKGSQFIDYLSSYIQELNATGGKMFVRGSESVKRKRNLYQQQSQVNYSQDFRKIKPKQYGYHNQAQSVLSEQQSLQNRSKEIGKISDGRNVRYNSLINNNGKSLPLYNSAQEHYSLLLENNQQSNNHPPILGGNQSTIEDLKRQLQKEKYCCTKLALQLQKYKENQTRNMKEIRLLEKTIQVLKIQVQNVKQLYENQAQQTQKILAYFQKQRQKDEQHKEKQNNRQQLMSRQKKMDKQPEVNFRQSSKSFNESYIRKGSINTQNQFQHLMKFKDLQSRYSELNPKFLSRLMDQFQKGQQSYRNQKKTARIKHPQVSNQFYRVEQQHFNFGDNIKNYSKKQKNSENQDKCLQNIFERSKNQKSQKKKHVKKRNNSSSSSEVERLQSSLQKLKKQYESFKAQTTKTNRFEQKPVNKKRSSSKNPVSTRQFSQIFVK